jgi:hypothetical protein
MRAIGLLIWLYFSGTPFRRSLFLLSVFFLATGTAALLYVPSWTLGTAPYTRMSLGLQTTLAALPWIAVILLFLSSSLMPLMLDRLVLGRRICILPRGRLILIASAAITAAAISLVTATFAVLAFISYPIPIDYSDLFTRTLTVSFVNFGVMYLALWAVSKLHGVWMLAGSLLALVAIGAPLGYIGAPYLPLGWPYAVGIGGWVLFGALILFGYRASGAVQITRTYLARLATGLVSSSSFSSGRETDQLLGTGRPWIVALGQVVPIVIAAWVLPVASVWLFYLTLFSAISGASTSYAASRSRGLWLRCGWSREELFHRVESAYWRHNSQSLAILLLLLVAFGSYLEFSTQLIALGIPLLALGTIVSTYLGLMMTRGLGWAEAGLGAATMALLMAAAVTAADETESLVTTIGLQALLAIAAVVYRAIAKARWTNIDWMLCRSDERTARASA